MDIMYIILGIIIITLFFLMYKPTKKEIEI